MSITDLTPAQEQALLVLAANEDRYVESWKRASQQANEHHPIPRVNERAMATLCRAGLSTLGMRPNPSVWTNSWQYKITPRGKEVADALA